MTAKEWGKRTGRVGVRATSISTNLVLYIEWFYTIADDATVRVAWLKATVHDCVVLHLHDVNQILQLK